VLEVERSRLLATPAGDPFTDDAEIAQAMAAFMPHLCERLLRPSAEELAALREGLNRLRMGRGGLKSMEAQLAAMILRRRPIWAVSTLGAPRRLPPIPGLFDLVVFDEASQCDVASAAPSLSAIPRS